MQEVRDKLTGFYNSEFLDKVLKREILRAERYKRHLTFLFLDIKIPEDLEVYMFFPVFKFIGEEINARTRNSDVKVRMGNRVLVILPETDENGARTAAEKIKKNLSAVEFYHETSGNTFYLGVDYSLCGFPGECKTKDDVMGKLKTDLGEKS